MTEEKMDRKRFEEILAGLKKAKVYDLEDDDGGVILETLYGETKYKFEETDLDVDKHRWYEISTRILPVGDWFIGIRAVTDLFSENMVHEDTGVTIEFYEVLKVPIQSYEYRKV